jgi:hypothetical protein
MMALWKIFILLKGIERLGSKMSNVVESIKTEFFLLDPKMNIVQLNEKKENPPCICNAVQKKIR